ncbi:MAG: hypothetical protein AAGC93_26165 [Cyanobacteria bacterium P01_F01_bin.53]
MVNASGHIEQQLSKLQMQTADIATELEALVDKYLDVLSQASKRQLVLAAYHICTQIYPESFLGLSLSQRARLQQNLQELGNRIYTQLNEKWATAKRLSLQPAEEDGLAVIRQLFLEATSAKELSEPASKDSNGDDNTSEQTDIPENSKNLTSSKQFQEKLLADVRNLMVSGRVEEVPQQDSEQEVAAGPMQPAQLMRRHILIEKAIRDVLKAVSENANDILQKADVIPEIPHALLAATADSERLGHTPMKTPNLVRLSIKILHEPDKDRFSKRETSPDLNEEDSDQWPDAEISAAIITGDDSAEDESDAADNATDEPISMPRFLQLESLPDFVMIHLRLSEIEFAETNVAVWRSRIRKKMAHLKRIGYAYKGAERQLAIAQAEDAWRASWTND